MEKKLNLGIIIPKLDHDHLLSEKQMIKQLSNKYNIKIFVLSGNHKENEYFDKDKIIYLNMELSNSILSFPINYYNNINELKDLKRKYRIDRSLSFGKKANILNVLSSTNDKTILNIYETYDDTFVLEKFIKRMYKKADKIVVDSKDKKAFLSNDYKIDPKDIAVIEDILPIDEISKKAAQDVEEELADFFKYKVLINYGELTEEKGQWHLIKAFFRIREKRDDVRLIIIGDGPLYKKLDELIKSMNMENEIKIIQEFNNPYKYLIRSDIFILSSHQEYNKGNVLDAMACARPVIVTTCLDDIINLVSPKNYVQNISEPFLAEYGILVPPATNPLNTKSKVLNKKEIILSDAIFKLLNDQETYEEYMEKAAHRAVDFSPEKIAQKWFDVIN
jgi:glycosyltransferase involved in cell wall biosynthesis